jgi:ABC-type phosphate transport system substrate-binding protein
MSRTHLLGTASAAALACISSFAFAQSVTAIQGGGSTLAKYDYAAAPYVINGTTYTSEMSLYNSTTSGYPFSTYWASGSGVGQQSFLNNDLTCDINKVTGNNGGACGNTPGGTNTVHYGASDATLSSSQEATWATNSYGQTLSRDLIQLPSMGVGIAIPVQNHNVTTNGSIQLSDHDLCEIFSGGFSDFSQITDSNPRPQAGTIDVVYRSDGSGTSFLLTNHLGFNNNGSYICTPGTDTPAGFTFSATTKFATLFGSGNYSCDSTSGLCTITGGPLAGRSFGENGGGAVQTELESLTSAVGYISPDFTSLDTTSADTSTLVDAAVFQGTHAYLPTTALITAALAKGTTGDTNLNPPTTATAGADPNAWVPLLGKVTAGYPIVGYTTFDVAQCYADPNAASAVIAFLSDHYNNSSYTAIQSDNGFVQVSKSGASKFLEAINSHILGNTGSVKKQWNDNIQNSLFCGTGHNQFPGR